MEDKAGVLIPILGVLIPIIAIVLGLGTAMLAIYLSYRRRQQMFTLYHQERMAAIDKGIDLPPIPDSFFADPAAGRGTGRDLRKGLVWLFIGIALGVALYANHQAKHALYALIPVALGLAHLIYYLVEGRREPKKVEVPPGVKTSASVPLS